LLPQTFDSFASRVLREAATNTMWEAAGYDGRIAAATRLILDGRAELILAHVRHILVDEVQDLVGVRAALVSALLADQTRGWTAFGDPAQAIYE
jgi:superfamily I DNA/RNA helicase